MADGEVDGDPQFDRPPVRAVNLTINFRPDNHIQSSHVAPLRALWGAEFPLVEESPPLPGPDLDGPTFLSPSSNWPLPYTRYQAVEDDRSLSFQADRLQVGWTFAAESDRPYPGFEELFGVLKRKFGQFEETLQEAGVSLQVTGSECQYVNVVDGLTGPELAVGILTNWAASAVPDLAKDGYLGVRLHACPDEEAHHCSSLVAVDGNSGEAPTLAVIVGRESDIVEDLGGVRAAHDELIGVFLRHTPTQLHEKWGRTK